MLIYWRNFSSHLLRLDNNADWTLSADLDEYDVPNLYLTVGEVQHVVASGDFVLQGRENMRLDEYDVLDYYNAVIQETADFCSTEGFDSINLEAIKEHLLRSFWWPKWRKEGRVTDDFWENEGTVLIKPASKGGIVS